MGSIHQQTNTLLAIAALLITPSFVYAQAKIETFRFDEIELCDEQDQCIDVAATALQNSKDVVGISGLNNSVEVKYDNKSYWIHVSEVVLNQQAEASFTCALKQAAVDNTPLSEPGDANTNAMMGVGEDC